MRDLSEYFIQIRTTMKTTWWLIWRSVVAHSPRTKHYKDMLSALKVKIEIRHSLSMMKQSIHQQPREWYRRPKRWYLCIRNHDDEQRNYRKLQWIFEWWKTWNQLLDIHSYRFQHQSLCQEVDMNFISLINVTSLLSS